MSSNDGQFCQGKILHIPWHQLISSSGGNSLQTNDFSNLNILRYLPACLEKGHAAKTLLTL